MKKIMCVLFLCVFISAFTLSSLAYMPQSAFYCDINYGSIPENAVYVDLLFPMSEKAEYYCEYNDVNGKFYDISQNSEIVNYNQDGFMSYTFHMSDAISSFEISDRDISFCYENYLEYTIDGETIYESPYSEDYEQIYDFNYCCKEFGYVKMAYLDKDGNILGVSNKVDIYKLTLSPLEVSLSLDGEKLESILDTGPPYWIMGLLIIATYVIGALLIILFIAFVTVIVIKKIKG